MTDSVPVAKTITGLINAVPLPPGCEPLLSLSMLLSKVTGDPPVNGNPTVGVTRTTYLPAARLAKL